MKQALSAWVEQEEERYRLTALEALADVDSGRVIDQQALQAWADSLEQDGRCQFRTDGIAMDPQWIVRSVAAVWVLAAVNKGGSGPNCAILGQGANNFVGKSTSGRTIV